MGKAIGVGSDDLGHIWEQGEADLGESDLG